MKVKLNKQIQRQNNISILRFKINKSWVNTKIINHLERNPYIKMSIDEIKDRILKDDLVASFFIKDPSKQNLTENIIAKYISSIDLVKDFINHSSNVELFVVDGQISNARKNDVKSIDYSWTTNGKKIFATQKYTESEGGAQDNQYNDVRNFLRNCKGNKDNYFFAIVDGDYYNNRINNLIKEFEDDNIKICHFEDLRERLLEL